MFYRPFKKKDNSQPDIISPSIKLSNLGKNSTPNDCFNSVHFSYKENHL